MQNRNDMTVIKVDWNFLHVQGNAKERKFDLKLINKTQEINFLFSEWSLESSLDSKYKFGCGACIVWWKQDRKYSFKSSCPFPAGLPQLLVLWH